MAPVSLTLPILLYMASVYGFDQANIFQTLFSIFHGSQLAYYIIEQRGEKMGVMTYANNKASGKRMHPRSLTRCFAICLKFSQGLLLAKSNSKASSETRPVRNLA